MSRGPHSALESRVAGIARNLGYSVTFEPTHASNRGALAHRLGALMRRHRFVPDLMVEHHGNAVFVECKGSTALIGGIMPFLRFIDEVHATGIICFADGAFQSIPRSIAKIAQDANVRVCSVSEVDAVMRDILG